ncbi:hypothetical protein HU200_036275 [Digitaria exilis]|uniref:Uncharacterized protein n=1 Tax=Digitaria exilis TaxID=1010633 RepID=A0A835EHY9_9POAL|nr:hypothetical protein HU200_036275 [Digitaria exilis]
MTTNSTSSTSLEASVEATLSTLRAQEPQRQAQPFTIFRVPAYIREGNRTGPYYHGAAALRAVEDHKWRYLHDHSIAGLVERSSSAQEAVKRRAEQSNVAAKSSIRLLYDVISKFDSIKRELVRSIGFGGLLCFPPLRQVNRRIKYSKEDVYRIFGIPCSGRSVYENGIPSKEVISKVTSLYLGGDGKEQRSIKVAQGVIERDYGVPSDIDKYDWAEYVIRKLFDAVLKVKSDLKGNVKGPLITGCTLFLQLRDPLEVCYSWAAMARADLQLDSLSDDEKFWEAGASLVRSLRAPAEAVGPLYFALVDSRRQTNKILCNTGIRAMSVYFQIMEIFMMGFRYNTASSGSESVNTSAAGSGINPLVRERCVDSFPRSPEHEWGNIFFDGCGHKFVHESPIWIFKDCMVMRAMAQYFLSVRAMKLSRGFELNTDARMLEDGAQLTARKISEKTEAAKRPFELGQSRHFVAMEDGQVIQFLSRVESEVESLRPWIVQYTPKYIEVLGAGLKMQISGFCEMEIDLFDAAIRRLKEIDDRLYCQKPYRRWRHFFESDFMESILAGTFDTNDPSIRRQIIGEDVSYDVVNCSMIFLPALLQHRWVCYAWDTEHSSITVFDPWLSPELADDLEELHCQVEPIWIPVRAVLLLLPRLRCWNRSIHCE